ncbi:MAG: amidohydrolase family protein [Candidatus Aminicenantes bacterium]|nr:amidohydrolase family protein [Candidatus Aminicenantes bacterium]
MMIQERLRLVVLAGLVLLLTGIAATAETLAVKAKTIYTAAGAPVANGVVLVENGKIKAVGPAVKVPAGAKVIQAAVVIPGLIDGHTHLGVHSTPNVQENADGNEMTNPVTPQVRALDSFNFEDPALKVGLAGGVTTIISRPGSGNVIGGTSVAVKLKNAPPEAMVLVPDCDLKMAIEGNPIGVYGAKRQLPSTLMGVYHLARKAFADGREYQKSWDKYEKEKAEGKEAAPPKRDLGKETIVRALKRELPVHIHCATAAEIASCLRLADEFNLRLSLGHCYWAHLIVDELRARTDVHFNVGPPMFFSYFDHQLEFRNGPALLAEAGLKVSLQTDALGGAQQNLRELAALCVRYGMREDDALRAVTIREAESVGLEKRIGSLEPGKDADLVCLDGEPFDLLTSVDRVLIDGKVEYERPASMPRARLETSTAPARGTLNLPAELSGTTTFALKAGTVLTMTGEPIRNGLIIVKDGRVEKVGAGLAVPAGYPVIDASEFFVMPGLVSPRSYVGITSNWRNQSSVDEISNPVVPEMQVRHAIEPQAPLFSFARQLGITTALVTPGDRNVVGGRGAVVKTTGAVVDKMIVRDDAVMVFGFGASAKRSGQLPSTRMGLAALLRENLVKAQEYQAGKDRYEKDKKGTPPSLDLAMEALVPVLGGRLPVLVHAEREDDIRTALRIADEYKLRLILDGATDAWKLAPELARREVPVILEDIFRGLGQVEDRGFNPQAAAILVKAGVRVAFRAAEGSSWTPGLGEAGGDPLEIAAFAVRNGLAEDAALRAVTIDAARIAGIADRNGSLEPGKDADLLVLRGHPFGTRSIPEAVFIGGRVVYERKGTTHLEKAR